jgi:hypothetical protein
MQLPYPSLAPFPKQDHIKHSPFPKGGYRGITPKSSPLTGVVR